MTDIQIVDDIIIPHEGGIYTNDPADAGGPTRWGITIPVLSAWRGHRCTADDIKNLTRAEATDIYIAKFVRPFDTLAGPLRVNAVDFGVNAGVDRASRMVQQVVGAVVDGKLGPETRAKAASRNWNTLYTGARILFYENLIISRPANAKFRNGWRNRALSMVQSELRLAKLRQGGVFTVQREPAPVFGFVGKAYLGKAA